MNCRIAAQSRSCGLLSGWLLSLTQQMRPQHLSKRLRPCSNSEPASVFPGFSRGGNPALNVINISGCPCISNSPPIINNHIFDSVILLTDSQYPISAQSGASVPRIRLTCSHPFVLQRHSTASTSAKDSVHLSYPIYPTCPAYPSQLSPLPSRGKQCLRQWYQWCRFPKPPSEPPHANQHPTRLSHPTAFQLPTSNFQYPKKEVHEWIVKPSSP